MIKQLVFTLFLLFSLSLFSSCSIFGGGDSEESAEGEDYYSEEEMDGEQTEEGEEGEEGEEAQYEESQEEEYGDEEDVYYIDEEDEDILEAEEGESIEIDDTSVADTGENYESGESSPSFFSDQSTPSVPAATPAAKKGWIPYKKIKSRAYNAAGFVVNAVYIARPGEDIQSISNTIFGSDQVSQLYAINPHIKARSVKVGDKIYYQSPHRPQDSSQLLFYFEDRGIQPSYHQIQAGENIRTIASQLLGHAESWKEVWATNPDLQSKGKLDQPMTIKYWPGGKGTEPALPPPPQPEQPVAQQEEQTPSFPPTEEGVDSSPSMGGTQEPELPEEAEENPPLPPSPQEESAIPSEPSEGDKNRSGFSQVDMALAGVLALVALICAFIIIKKRMNKKKDFDYTAANFEIDE